MLIDNPDEDLDEEKVMEDCFDVGAEDVNFEEGCVEVLCATADLRAVREGLEAKGYTLTSAEAAYIPSTYTAIPEPELADKMAKLLDLLEDNDDVQSVWHNWEE